MKNMKKSILYLTNVPWGWIKQRPHFMAEYLSKEFDVTVFQQHYLVNPFKRRSLLVADTVKESDSFHIYDYIMVPNKKYIPAFIVNVLNYLTLRFMSLKLHRNYDVIWFSSPMVYNRFKHLTSRSDIIIYDCMDDYLEFPDIQGDDNKRDVIKKAETELLRMATLTFFSADYLRKKIFSRYNLKVPSMIVNNAFEMPKLDALPISDLCNTIRNLEKPFVYIGTVSEWFDFSLVLKLLCIHKHLNFVIVGPQLVPIPSHPRLHYLGPVDHDQVYSIINSAYALVMPFVVNELIRSVNPVKLYEYIYSGKPVVAVRYEETEKFKDHVYLYSDIDEFNNIIDNLMKEDRTKEQIEDCKRFAESNTWEKRCETVNAAIKGLFQ